MRSKDFSHIIILGAFILMFNAGCKKNLSHEGKIIFTQLPVKSAGAKLINSLENKYAPNMKIAMANRSDRLENIQILTAEFYSARAPEISYDGSTMVFSAQKTKGEPWQIWTMNLESKEFVQVTESRTNCTDPVWLPNGDIAFSKLVTDDNSLKYHALHTITIGGCCEERITFQPHEDVNSSILNDGRILVASKQMYPDPGSYKFIALRPDGTKAELFHMTEAKSHILGKAVELNGTVYFSKTSELSSVKFSRPLHSEEFVISKDRGDVIAAAAIDDKNLMITIMKPDERTYGIGTINLDDPYQEDFYYNDSEYHIIEAVVVIERVVPRKLPSRVNPEMNSGFLFSMNADASDIDVNGKTSMVQVLGMYDTIGATAVEEDGSFYLELTADQPVRFQTLDESGSILRGPSSWMWVRPNERRGCAGCHQDREVAPENVVPKAMNKAPLALIRK